MNFDNAPIPATSSSNAPAPVIRILLAEDVPLMRAIAKRGLHYALKESKTAFELHEAGDGIEAMKHIENAKERYDLVFTDDLMPGLTGSQLIQHLGQHPEFPARRVYLVSSSLTPEIREQVSQYHPYVTCRDKGSNLANIATEAIKGIMNGVYNSKLSSRELSADEIRRLHTTKQRVKFIIKNDENMQYLGNFSDWMNERKSISGELRDCVMFHTACGSSLSRPAKYFDLGGTDSIERFVAHEYHQITKQ